ncbi:MAG: glycosyltransferase [Agriterribacter sp.]
MNISKTAGRKILFANFPADGHFNPLTGLAVHLREAGHEVRWYTSNTFTTKLQKLGIVHYPFKKAVDVAGNDFDATFPGRKKCRTQISKLKFDMIHAFILRGPEYYEDIKAIREEYPFDMVIADCAFPGVPFIKELMTVPVLAIGVLPLNETSRDLPPAGLGIEPSYTYWGKRKQAVLRWVTNRFIFGEPNKVMRKTLAAHGIDDGGYNVFELLIKKSDMLLQSGTPGFEYYRSDLSGNIKFIGALLPHTAPRQQRGWYNEKLKHYSKVVLVTQGTVEKDINKLLVPTLEAFKNSDTLVIATTGGTDTAILKQRYPQDNFIIEDYIPFNDVMPYASVYITNGGYGGVMLGIQNKLPMVVAGVHEGKNEICARVGYFKLGVNLKTEKPTPDQVKQAVAKIAESNEYKQNVTRLAAEFMEYDPNELCARYVETILPTAKEKMPMLKQQPALV